MINLKLQRGRTIAAKELLREIKKVNEADPEETKYPEKVVRPITRADCKDGPRPCPFVSCSSHLYLDVNRQTGAVKFNFPGKEVWELEETCVLDVADKGGITLEEVGVIMNLTRERIRQVEVRGIAKVKSSPETLRLGTTLLGCSSCGAELDGDDEILDTERLCDYCRD